MEQDHQGNVGYIFKQIFSRVEKITFFCLAEGGFIMFRCAAQRCFIAIFLLMATLYVIPAKEAGATIISMDWEDAGAGNGYITRSVEQGLDYLDLSQTLGMSWNQVDAELSAGGTFEGFRFATETEVIALANGNGFT